MAQDFEESYGYRPWLVETFVSSARHSGISLRAANWVGATQGRGRQDRKGLAAEPVKEMYELEPGCRASLSARPVVPVSVGEGLSRACWAENEFGCAPLGDRRLTKRLVDSAHIQAEAPRSSFSVAAGGDMAAVTGFYRLIDRPRDEPSAVTPENILATHRERTLGRMQIRDTILCLQDGTDLNFATRAQCDDLGVIGHNQTCAKTAGLHLHTAVDDAGLPLGLLKLEFDAPQPGKDKLPEDRKPARWLRGLRECADAARRLDGTRLISVREADFFEMFAEQRRLGNVDILVRARYSRKLSKTEKLFDRIRAAPVQGRRKLVISRLSQQVSKRKASEGRKERVADMEVRYQTVSLPSTTGGTAPLPVQVVHVSEPAPPQGVKPVEWFLITTVAVSSIEDAMQVIAWYALRWRIEDWHRALKSGCEVEETGHHTAARLERVIAINAVIAWRIMLMALLARKTPNDPAEILFSDLELLVIEDYATKLPRAPNPKKLKGAVLIVAIMAGYRNRKHDPPPGHQKIWQGYSCLAKYCQADENLAEIKFVALKPLLDERTRRRWAAVEARAIGRGGIARVAEATGMSRTQAGIKELDRLPEDEPERLRSPGGSRKPLTAHDPELLAALEKLPVTHGDPSGPLRWTCSSAAHLAQELWTTGHRVSERTGMLHDAGYSLQANRKMLEGNPDRDAQFSNRRVKAFQRLPVVSVDAKKKELVGKNNGKEWKRKGQPEAVNVHDFPDKVLGKALPYGVYDLTNDTGWVSVGVDHDTATFAVETLRRWWRKMGCHAEARRLLITADGGGSNGSRNRLWKWGSLPTISASRSPSFRPGRASGTKSNIGCSSRTTGVDVR